MQSLDRLLRILEAVAAKGHPSSVAEVTEQVGLSISTVSRLMKQFADAGILQQEEGDRRYSLGPRLIALSHDAEANLDINAIVRPVLERLRDSSGETASLHVMRGAQRVCLLEVPSRREVRRVVPVGLVHDLDGGATAGVLLAGLEEKERRERIKPLKLSKARRAELEEEIASAEEHGWALSVDEWIEDLSGLSAAVYRGQSVFGAISVSGPSSRFTREAAMEQLDTVLAGAAEISARIGGRQGD